MGSSKTMLMVIGAVILLLGIAGLVIPTFNTQQTDNVAQIGSLKVQAQHPEEHEIPQPLAIGAVVVGVVLLGAGAFRANA